MKILVATLISFAAAFGLEFQTVPTAQSVHMGERAQFEVQVSGNPPFVYSWYFKGVLQEGELAAQFTTPPLALADDRAEVICFVQDASARTITTKPVAVRVLPVSSKVMTLDGQLNLVNGEGDFDVDLKVALYSKLEGGQALYTESFDDEHRGKVEVRNGRFQVRLGLDDGGVALQQVVQQNKSLYVEFKVGANLTYETLAPRLPLTAYPYSLTLSGN